MNEIGFIFLKACKSVLSVELPTWLSRGPLCIIKSYGSREGNGFISITKGRGTLPLRSTGVVNPLYVNRWRIVVTIGTSSWSCLVKCCLDDSTSSWFVKLISHFVTITSSARLIPTGEKWARSLAEEMNGHMAAAFRCHSGNKGPSCCALFESYASWLQSNCHLKSQLFNYCFHCHWFIFMFMFHSCWCDDRTCRLYQTKDF